MAQKANDRLVPLEHIQKIQTAAKSEQEVFSAEGESD